MNTDLDWDILTPADAIIAEAEAIVAAAIGGLLV